MSPNPKVISNLLPSHGVSPEWLANDRRVSGSLHYKLNISWRAMFSFSQVNYKSSNWRTRRKPKLAPGSRPRLEVDHELHRIYHVVNECSQWEFLPMVIFFFIDEECLITLPIVPIHCSFPTETPAPGTTRPWCPMCWGIRQWERDWSSVPISIVAYWWTTFHSSYKGYYAWL